MKNVLLIVTLLAGTTAEAATCKKYDSTEKCDTSCVSWDEFGSCTTTSTSCYKTQICTEWGNAISPQHYELESLLSVNKNDACMIITELQTNKIIYEGACVK